MSLSKEEEFIDQVKKFIDRYGTINYDSQPEALEPDRKQVQSMIDIIDTGKLNLSKIQSEWIDQKLWEIKNDMRAISDLKSYMKRIDRVLTETSQLLDNDNDKEYKKDELEFQFRLIRPNKYDIGKQELEVLKKKFQKIFPLEKKELESKKCGHLFEVTTKQKDICINDPKFSKENFKDTYFEFQLKYEDAFLTHLFQNSDCYGGVLILYVNRVEKWASLAHDELTEICLNKITVVHLNLWIGTFRKEIKEEDFLFKSAHAASLIIDPNSKTIKLYDSHGSSGPFYEPVRQFLTQYAKKHEKLKRINFEVLPGDIVCPATGPQFKSGDSLCANWTLLFLYTHVKCPHADLYQIQELLAGLAKDRLEIIMQGWSCFLWNYIEEHHILVKA